MRWSDQQWNARYEEVKAYHEKNGNLRIPVRYVSHSGVSLSHWLAEQRQRRKKNNLSEDCIAKLDALGIYWGDNVGPWEKRYSLAKAYYEGKSELLENITALLDSIGMIWINKHELAWERFYQAACEYHKQHGSLDMPKTYKTENGMLLGRWLKLQRKLYAQKDKKRLTDESIQRLNALGMIWAEATVTELPVKKDKTDTYSQEVSMRPERAQLVDTESGVPKQEDVVKDDRRNDIDQW